ncbi:hypothetical protein HanOQP8_Chr10g0373721 [Helianthus annuus]|nr:hypothetical protein HanOQP8_Chr10g0373721 [Helianthus annuus]
MNRPTFNLPSQIPLTFSLHLLPCRRQLVVMEEGELDFSNTEMFTDPNMGDILSNDLLDRFFDDIFKDSHACTHTHTCNPPGPDSSHTHTCYHVHRKIMPAMSGDDDKTPTDDTAESADKK